MKAEERHKLQTNALADRLGRMIRGAKQGPSRGTVLNVFLVLVLVGLVVFFFWTRSRGRHADAESWVALYSGLPSDLKELRSDTAPAQPGRAAHFQFAYLLLWEGGIKGAMSDPHESLVNIRKAYLVYKGLAEEVKDDPVYGPEALYGIAVAEEALAFASADTVAKHLESAQRAYERVSTEFPNSALAKEAAKRAADLKGVDNPRRIQIQDFYIWMEGQTREARQKSDREAEGKRIQQEIHEQIKKLQQK